MAGLLAHLRARHPLPRWAFFDELRDGTGYSHSRTIDAMAFDTWPSGHGQRIAYEVKVSKNDFKKELADPDKRKWVETCCHQTWFVMPKGLVDPSEIPESWGLLEGTEKALRVRKIAPVRAAPADPTYNMVMAMLRRAAEQASQARDRTFSLEGDALTPDQLHALVEEKVAAARTQIREEREHLRKTERDLRDAKRILLAPLDHLWSLAGVRHQLHWNAESGSLPDVAAIDAMIEATVARRLAAAVDAIRVTHRATGKLLAQLEPDKPADEGPWPT